MRKTVRPVSLARLLSAIWAFQDVGIGTPSRYRASIASPDRRAREVLAEVVAGGFMKTRNRSLIVTDSGRRLLEKAKEREYAGIHRELLHHPHYSLFHELLSQNSQPLTSQELIDLGNSETGAVSLNRTGVHILGEWSERCGSAQRSLSANNWLPTPTSEKPVRNEAERAINVAYARLDKQKGQFFRKRFVEIPLLREEVSRILAIHRTRVDDLLSDFYRTHIGECELAGAPLVSHAKVSRFKARRLVEPSDFMTFHPSGESWMEQPGLQWKGKQYYFFGMHGGLR